MDSVVAGADPSYSFGMVPLFHMQANRQGSDSVQQWPAKTFAGKHIDGVSKTMHLSQ